MQYIHANFINNVFKKNLQRARGLYFVTRMEFGLFFEKEIPPFPFFFDASFAKSRIAYPIAVG